MTLYLKIDIDNNDFDGDASNARSSIDFWQAAIARAFPYIRYSELKVAVVRNPNMAPKPMSKKVEG